MNTSTLSLYTKRFFSGTLLSRFSGLIRDLSMAFAFGDHPSVAAFMVAFRLSNLFRRLLSEGPFQSAFIPYFEGLRAQGSAKAHLFFRQLSFLMGLFLIGLIVLGEIGLWTWIFSLNVSSETQEILRLTALMLPSLLFICLYGLNISLLHCHDTFFLPSVAPFISNVVWILGAVLLRHTPVTAAMPILSKIIVLGFIGQWLFTLPPTLKHAPFRLKEMFVFNSSPEIKKLAKSFTYGAIGVGAAQINALLDACFARYADLRGPLYLWYSIRMQQLALAVLGIACVSSVVPRLSRAIKSGNKEEAQALFGFSYKRILAVMIPCTFALFALGPSAVNLLYGRGSFSAEGVLQTSICLWGYGLGLLPTTMVILFSSLFYAEHDFKTPLKISLYTIVFHLFLNVFFVFGLKWGALSTALSTSLSAWANFLVLSRKCPYKPKERFISVSTFGLVSVGLFSAVCVGVFERFFLQETLLPVLLAKPLAFSRDFFTQGLYFTVSFFVFLGALLLYCLLFKNKELLSFLKRTTQET